jgi:hypothetical protein
VVAQVGIYKTQEFSPGSEVYDLVDSRERERILQARIVKACVIHTHLPFSILFWHKDQIGYPIWVLNFFNKAGGQKPRQLFARSFPG